MSLLFDFNAGIVERNNFSLQFKITGTGILKLPLQKKNIFIISIRNPSKLYSRHIDKLVILYLQRR